MDLLLFFALPLATILLAIVLQKILKCPILVSITFFAIYLIIIFALNTADLISNLANGLIAVIIYTILAYIVAWIVNVIMKIKERLCGNRCETREGSRRNSGNNNENCGSGNNNDLLRISCRCNNGNSQNLLTINSNCSNPQNDNGGTCSGCENENNIATSNSGVAVSGNVIPNQENCGRTGWIRGCYRRY